MADVIDSKYWLYHVWFIAVYPVSILVLLITPSGGEKALTAGIAALIVVTAVASFGSMIGYYVEAKRFRAADNEWVPTWWAYVAIHIVLSPAIAAPVYLFDRWRALGLPWREALSIE